jgi:L-amino acid N-acyltransferase
MESTTYANKMFQMIIRAAQKADVVGIRDIYNHVIATSTAVYTTEPRSLEDRITWFEDRAAKGFPVLVAEDCGMIVGFATYGEWRGSWAGYLYTVEHTVHVIENRRGQGIGKALMVDLLQLCKMQGKHVMLGAVDAANTASLRFHETLGFERASHFKEVGRKFDRWLDLVFVQKTLS